MGDGAGTSMVLIGGEIKEVNDIVSAEFNGLTYRWRITSISKSGVVLQPIDALPAR